MSSHGVLTVVMAIFLPGKRIVQDSNRSRSGYTNCFDRLYGNAHMCVLRPIEDRVIAIIRVPCRFDRYLVGFQSKIQDKEYPNWDQMSERCKINSQRTRL